MTYSVARLAQTVAADSIVHHINTSRRLKQYLCTARYVLLHLLSKYLPNFSSQYFGYLVMWRKLMTLIIATIVYILSPMSLFVYDPVMWLQPTAMKNGKTTTTIDRQYIWCHNVTPFDSHLLIGYSTLSSSKFTSTNVTWRNTRPRITVARS